MIAMQERYSLIPETPSVDTFCRLRTESGLSAKSAEAAARGLAGGLFAVQVMFEGQPVGMGRIIGDGGTAYQVTDIAVLPAHQGQGLGKRIMAALMAWLDANTVAGAYVSLIADGKAQDLYAQYGFKHTAPASVGMAWRKT